MSDTPNRPQGREKYVTNDSKGVHLRGEGLGTGKVGRGESNVTGANRPQAQRPAAGQTQRPVGAQTQQRASQAVRAGGKSKLLLIVAVIIVGYLIIRMLSGGGDGTGNTGLTGNSGAGTNQTGYTTVQTGGGLSSLLGSGISSGALDNLYSTGAASTTSLNTWSQVSAQQSAEPSTAVSTAARGKYTTILGSGEDKVTVMVYMCGTDLESQYSMATKDLMEMINARLGSNVHVLVYTGGCTKWNNTFVSADRNQIYEVISGQGLRCVMDNAGTASMVEPSTLSSFIQWCAEKYPANRNELILWDHGGGSVTGYGYDQKFPKKGSMSLAGIDQALTDGGVQFDFIGFDACLMATVENGLMLDKHADYMIASEETEPGIGWYYTDWLTALGSNPSMSTLQIGKNITDSFVSTCGSECSGQSATLSVVDLAELSASAPAALKEFSQSLSSMIADKQYAEISTARSQTREFARSSKIDQIDLVHFANNLGTEESAALSQALLSAVKYNKTSSDMSNSYGLSIYFPYRKTSSVSAAVSTYSAIGMDDSYSQAIREFASLELSGQVTSGGGLDASPLSSLFGSLTGVSYGGSETGSMDMISGLLGNFLSAGGGDFFSGRAMSTEDTVQYISDNYFDYRYLVWQDRGDGTAVISMPEAQWELVTGLDLNCFYDNGEGFVDLGIDNVFEFDNDGYLLPPTDHTWLAINGQPVTYYHEYSSGSTHIGRIPALLNGELVDLIVVFDESNPRGYLAGARPVYDEDETEAVAKNLLPLELGDTLDFVSDFYSYDGTYLDSYKQGEQMTVEEDMVISNVDVGEGALRVLYRFTDIYQQHYWTVPLDGR